MHETLAKFFWSYLVFSGMLFLDHNAQDVQGVQENLKKKYCEKGHFLEDLFEQTNDCRSTLRISLLIHEEYMKNNEKRHKEIK